MHLMKPSVLDGYVVRAPACLPDAGVQALVRVIPKTIKIALTAFFLGVKHKGLKQNIV